MIGVMTGPAQTDPFADRGLGESSGVDRAPGTRGSRLAHISKPPGDPADPGIPALSPSRTLFAARQIQAVVATSLLNRSAGVSHARVLRGRSLSRAAMASRSSWEWTDRSVPLGRN